MAAAIPIETTVYRIALVDPRSRNLCIVDGEKEHPLIRVQVPRNTRPAQQLQNELRRERELAVVILDIMVTDGCTSPCAVAELLERNVPVGYTLVQLERLPTGELSEEEQIALQAILYGNASNLFAQIGWIDEAIAWLEASTGGRIRSKAHIDQRNASGAFTLIRFPMQDGCDFWLKATGTPHEHERPVSCLLSKLCPGHVPEVVAERSAWNAWLMRGEGESISELSPAASVVARSLETAARSLAELQVKTAGAERDLLDAGVADHRAHALRSRAEVLFGYFDEAMDYQTSTKVPRIETARLRELQNIFEDACGYSESLGLPDTVLHGDLNLGNILLTDERCLFIDWAEACVGKPLVTFEHLLLLNSTEMPGLKAACDRRLRATYRSTMSMICDSRAIDAGFVCIPIIAAASAILGRGDWLQTPLRNDPRRQAYVRAVVRHMDRAAREPMLLETLSV